ncbi:MAG: flagellar biosynthesis protein FlhA [Acidobacteriia bacterium]|nr:flagellar biosynthesis protein FlhA [Terriglobia bacterium]
MAAPNRTLAGLTSSAADWVLPAAVVCTVFVMLIPLPGLVLDFLLAISITASILVLLSALYILRPVQFSVFPSLLLLLTLFRLSLNLASSRRILLHGSEGASAAGHVIEAFGQFVVGGNYVVGFVLFLALIAIQYLVVSHGAVRTAEVTARFTLDALPGKQMAIDADLNAGLLDESQARQRREAVAREAEFYGAMDGAARFNQRDSLATILITAINIVAGFLIGVFQLDIPFQDALKTYTVLTVGDGLVTMIPSLLVSVAGGIVVTRTASDNGLGAQLGRQLLANSKPLWIAAGVVLTLALVPGLPKLPFFALAAGLVALARHRGKHPVPAAEPETTGHGRKPEPSAASADSIESLLKVDELSLEVGYGLVALVDEKQGGQLLQRVRSLRRHLALQLGFIVPPVHITDNLHLKPHEYTISLRGVEVSRWEMQPNMLLAVSSEPDGAAIPGMETHEPAFGVAARWIAPSLQEQALAAGYVVVDQTSAMATHISEIIKEHAHEILTRQETKRLLDALAESHPKLTEELVPKVLSLGEVQKVMQQLLREQVAIRDLPTILETLVDIAPTNRNPVLLVEAARQALGRGLVRPLLGNDGQLHVVSLDPSLEEELQRSSAQSLQSEVALQPSLLRRLLNGLRSLVGDDLASATPILLCGSPGRFHLRRVLEPLLPRIVVLSPNEIPPRVAVHSLGVVR